MSLLVVYLCIVDALSKIEACLGPPIGAVCSLKVDVEKRARPEFTVVGGIVLVASGLPLRVTVTLLRFSSKLCEPDRAEQGRVGLRSRPQSRTESHRENRNQNPY
jgi:hypothetical protein